MHTLLSIITPIYKIENYIGQCIESIISQKGNFELILIDDGSPDKCPEICDKYSSKDSRIRIIHKSNGGVSSARNAGLNIATGDWIWFVDGDDYIVNDVLDSICLACQKYDYVDLIQMGMKSLYNNQIISKEVEEIKNLNKNDFLIQHITHYNHRILFKKEIIEKHKLRFSENIQVAEDQEFQLKYLMLCNQLIQLPICGYIYRQRDGSATHNNNISTKIVRDTFIVLSNLNNFILTQNINAEEWLQNRITIMLKTLLHAASQNHELNKKEVKHKLNQLAQLYQQCGINSFKNPKIQLARKSLTLYFILNKFYIKIKSQVG